MKYISELLYNNECVIIPELGGFISNYQSSEILSGKNLFVPPSKKILFNSKLTNNDGLLANYIAEEENISFKEANKIISRFVLRCNTELNNKQKVRFPGVGIIFRDENNKLLFEQNTTVNYLPEAFGLTPFNSPMIKRETPYERFDKKIKNSPIQTNRKTGFVRTLKWAAVIVPIMAVGSLTIFNVNYLKNKYSEYAVYFSPITGDKIDETENKPLNIEDIKNKLAQKRKELAKFNITTTSIIPTGGNSISNNNSHPAKEISEEAVTETPIKTEAETNKQTVLETPIIVNSSAFHIITGSFKNIKNANKHIIELKASGFSPVLLEQNRYGFYRVSAISEISRTKAVSQLSVIKTENYPDAWLCKK
ncbi:MAG: hypothetical protein U9R32_00015 [Bacteroidota bacterium]|nr:hypothetical protein [Bacteroidota bacterium]